jgi:predicted AlkP superfamily phosphohydrolase/phosphomutase
MRWTFFALILCIATIITLPSVSGYIDPGTGAIIGGSLLSVILGALAFLGGFLLAQWRKAKKIIERIWPWILGVFVFGAAILAAVLLLIANPTGNIMGGGKVILLGIDGAEDGVISQLMAEGALPNMQRLAAQGSHQELAITHPSQTPSSWTTIATGINPGKHNIFDFIVRDPKTYMLSLSTNVQSGSRFVSPVKATPFWKDLRQHGIPTQVYRWPVTFPADEKEMYAGQGVVDIKGTQGTYTFYTEKDYPKTHAASAKIVKVEGNPVETYIKGPYSRSKDGFKENRVPLTITIEEDTVTLDGKTTIGQGEWSDWIQTTFKVGAFKRLRGIYRVYVVSASPFEMYMTPINLDPTDPAEKITAPSSLAAELAEEVGLHYTLGIPEETHAVDDHLLPFDAYWQQSETLRDEKEAIFWKAFERFQREDTAFLGFVFDNSDRTQHMAWKDTIFSSSGGISPEIRAYFERFDAFLGKMLEQVDDNTTILIMSDHGFTSFERGINLNNWLQEEGYLVMRNDYKTGDDSSLFAGVDWTKTQAYAAGFSGIYINKKGRERDGIVDDVDVLSKEIREKLSVLKDPEHNASVFKGVYAAKEVWDGPYLDNAPDIVVGFNAGYRVDWDTALGALNKNGIFTDNERYWSGTHLVDPSVVPGVLISNKNLSKGARTLDIAPTILSLFGITPKKVHEGKSLT